MANEIPDGVRVAVEAPSVPRDIVPIETRLLKFDPENPRFYRLSGAATDEHVIEEMLDDEGVQDLMSSIGQQGYFPGEPLLVTKADDGTFIVVEGNRRLAAVKLLNGELAPPKRKSKSVAMLREDATQPHPTALPCIVHEDRNIVLRYLGYRHITGIKEWDALSKAKYLEQLRLAFYTTQEHSDQLRQLAKGIGSKPHTVGKLLAALAIYEYAEERRFFGLPNLNTEAIDFSYITTAINYRNIADWLSLEEPVAVNPDKLNEENVRDLFFWMFVQQQNGRTILRETRNLKELSAIVVSSDGLRILKESGNIDDAFLYTNGPVIALAEALEKADARLRIVWEMLLKSTPNTDHLAKAEEISKRAKRVHDQIARSLEEEALDAAKRAKES